MFPSVPKVGYERTISCLELLFHPRKKNFWSTLSPPYQVACGYRALLPPRNQWFRVLGYKQCFPSPSPSSWLAEGVGVDVRTLERVFCAPFPMRYSIRGHKFAGPGHAPKSDRGRRDTSISTPVG
ncbi:hypothetical protein CEXT_489641 [Caerostris extrusa]|uniref:Uncharacterized protein n=1 Tax=Caerostris extrusa TaxID=172846 RepID=A0AAV4Y1W3_CAEEX|nr:hypothetical protein CEXT_489641 [Caerostris extrusa]